MAINDLLVIFQGAMALLFSAALFVKFDDRWTGILLSYIGSLLWFLLGISAFDVQLGDVTPGKTVIAFVVIGFGLGTLVFLFATYDLLTGSVEDATEANIELVQ